jgi:hypothetical protein
MMPPTTETDDTTGNAAGPPAGVGPKRMRRKARFMLGHSTDASALFLDAAENLTSAEA